MLRVCIHKPTNKIIEMQSLATEGTLIKNNKQYYPESELEERLVSEIDYKNMMALQEPVKSNLKIEFSKLTTPAEKIEFIAQRLGLL